MFLGLDVIGNPSRLFSNFEHGIKDLIEETQKGLEDDKASSGIVGVAVGVKELLGHVVGKKVENLGWETEKQFQKYHVFVFFISRGFCRLLAEYHWQLPFIPVGNHRPGLQESK